MSAFSNGTEYDIWSQNWCCKCLRDDTGLANEGTYCFILSKVMLSNEVPDEWTPGTDDLHDRYHCKMFKASYA